MSLKLANTINGRRRLGQGGFTLPELLATTAVILVMTVIALLLLRPVNHVSEHVKAERRLELAAMAQALKRYKAAQGYLPADVPSSKTIIGVAEGAYDLCNVLVPAYIKDIPLDPQGGVKYWNQIPQDESGQPCNEPDIDYLSGYIIVRAKDGSLTLAAPFTGKDALSTTVR